MRAPSSYDFGGTTINHFTDPPIVCDTYAAEHGPHEHDAAGKPVIAIPDGYHPSDDVAALSDRAAGVLADFIVDDANLRGHVADDPVDDGYVDH